MRIPEWANTQWLALAALVVWGMAAAACATTYPLQGQSGPVAWEVVDVVQKREPGTIWWQYVIVLTETAGRGVQFEQVAASAFGLFLEGGVSKEPFEGRLEPHGELRVPDAWGIRWAEPGSVDTPAGTGATLFRRFTGKDFDGDPVTVDVRFRLDRSVGRKAP